MLLVALTAGAAGYLARGLVTRAGASTNQPSLPTPLGAHSVYVPEVRHPVEVRAEEEHLVRWLTKRVGAPMCAPRRSPTSAGS